MLARESPCSSAFWADSPDPKSAEDQKLMARMEMGYFLLTEFEGRTVKYAPRFFPPSNLCTDLWPKCQACQP